MNNLLLSLWNASRPIRNYYKKGWFTFLHYHRIDSYSFENHIEYLSNKYEITHLDLLREYYKTGEALPNNSLFITFDDGWESNYSLLPIIEEKNIPITIFLTTGFIGTNKKPAPLTNFQKRSFHTTGNDFLTEPKSTMLDFDQIKEMSKLVNFQSHGVNHYPSTYLTADQLRSELLESKRTIENITGKQVYAHAYPYNRASEREARIVKSCGYVMARSGGRKMNRSTSNPFILNSIGVENDCSLTNLKKKIFKAELKTLNHFY